MKIYYLYPVTTQLSLTMTITCDKTHSDSIRMKSIGWADASSYLTVGKCYVVYASMTTDGITWYLICDDNFGISYNYPLYIPEFFFYITDNSYSSYWITTEDSAETGFKEILSIPGYLEKLIDGNLDIIHNFNEIKSRIDKENGYGKNMFIFHRMPPADHNTELIQIVGKISGKDALFARYEKCLESPYGQIQNWDILSFILSKLDWIIQKKVWIWHEQLPVLAETDLVSYIKCLDIACQSLKDNPDHELSIYFPEQTEKLISDILLTK